MRGARLAVTQREAEKAFKIHEGFSSRNTKQSGRYYRLFWTKDAIQRMLGFYRKTKVPCSCYMCGNPRRHWRHITIREVKQHLLADAQYEEIGWHCRKLRWQRGWYD